MIRFLRSHLRVYTTGVENTDNCHLAFARELYQLGSNRNLLQEQNLTFLNQKFDDVAIFYNVVFAFGAEFTSFFRFY